MCLHCPPRSAFPPMMLCWKALLHPPSMMGPAYNDQNAHAPRLTRNDSSPSSRRQQRQETAAATRRRVALGSPRRPMAMVFRGDYIPASLTGEPATALPLQLL
ncbi:uncharacterized protein [Triticum aestivum]|uniref:uncharacterized protein n=1 Tax=Triticum aestivum TaxID=4565 RepID=UPI001D01BFDD|nr:uncharacterized protein LOC123144577 [Triticum aestivum]